MRSRSKRAPATIPAAARSASRSVSAASKRCSLSSWRSLLYVSGSACRTPCSAVRWPDDPRRLGAQELGRVGVLLLRHDRRPARPRVGQLDEAELLAGPEHELGAQAREVRRARRRGGEEVQDEVAVGDGVDRVRGDVGRSRARRRPSAGRWRSSRRPARRRRAAGPASARHGEAQPLAVARQHPDVGEQVVGEVDGLGALEMGVARQRPVEVGLGGGDRAPASAPRRPRSPPAAASRVKSATSVATWSLRERAVWSLPPTGPATSVSRRSTAMWMSSSSSRNGKRPSASSAATASSAGQQRVAVGAGDDVLRREHARVRAGLGDVLAPQAAVERRASG